MARRVPNPIYNLQTLERFRSAVTHAQKISIIASLGCPAFSQDQIEFLQSEDPAHWAAQDEILNQHGCGLTVLQPGDHTDLTTPTVYDIDQNFQGAYIMPKLIIDVLTNVVSFNELKRPDVKILDIGTGRGQIIQALRDYGVSSQVHGLDTPNRKSYYVLDHSYDQFINADLRCQLPIQDDTYDIILCSNVFMESVMHMENDPPMSFDCLDEILRVLRPSGIFVFSIDRFNWVKLNRKLTELTNISILEQRWGYHRDRLCMFPPTRLCIAIQKH